MDKDENQATEVLGSEQVSTISIDVDALKPLKLKSQASAILNATDFAIVKASENSEKYALGKAWLAWREALREVVRGNATEIPPEPQRYTSAPQPSDPSTPPPEVLAEAQPDESLVELKTRLLFEFASLRNMLIGHIPMTEAQLLRLQALEHPKFQTWLQA